MICFFLLRRGGGRGLVELFADRTHTITVPLLWLGVSFLPFPTQSDCL